MTGVSVKREGRIVLDGVDLELPPGERLAIVGPNGGGKTTLLRAALGWVASTGAISLAGLSPTRARRHGGIVGYVPQRPAAPAGLPMTGRQAVRLAARAADAELADTLLEKACNGLSDAPLASLSGGQLQQMFLARALANRPKVLLLDEPTVGLDAAAVDRLVALLDFARDSFGTAVACATHDHLVALRLADTLLYLDKTVRYLGPADQVPHHLDTRLCHHE